MEREAPTKTNWKTASMAHPGADARWMAQVEAEEAAKAAAREEYYVAQTRRRQAGA